MLATRKTDRYYKWHPHLYRGCWIVLRWKREGKNRVVDIHGGTTRGKPRQLFACAEEAIAKAEELNA